MRVASFCLALTAGLASPAFAQSATPIDQGRADRTQPIATLPGAAVPAIPVAIGTNSDSATIIRTISFVGSDVPLIVANAAHAFVGRPASRDNLQALADAMTAAYAESSVALFTIAIPVQDLSSGDVKILVAEGHIEAVILSGEVTGRKLKLVRALSDKLTREKVTSRANLERYLSLIQDIPGLKVKSQLKMGEGKGGVRLLLELAYQRPTLTFAFDNRTTRLVKDGQLQAVAKGYGLLREGDETILTGMASVDFNDLLFVGVSHSTPISSEGMRLTLNSGLLRTRPSGTGLNGEAENAGVTISFPVIRSYKQNLTINVAIDGLNSENAAFGSIVSTEKSRAVRAGVNYGRSSPRRSLGASMTVSKGIDALGADVTDEIGQETFLKANGRISLTQAIGARAAIRLRVSGQWSTNALPAVERFAVGGAEFGRAFELGLLSTDRGVAGLAELAWRPIPKGKFAQSELYSFIDAAEVRLLERPKSNAASFDLASAGAGVRLAWNDKAALELEYAQVLDVPYSGYNGDWRLSVGWRLNLRPN